MRIEEVRVINCSPTLELPKYATSGSDAVDLYACFDAVDGEGNIYPVIEYESNNEHDEYVVGPEECFVLPPGHRCLIPTGLVCQLPIGFRLHISPRSGLALKKGITVLNTPGKIDSDYRGMIGVIIINHSNEDFIINHGDKIAQMSLEESIQLSWVQVTEVDDTERGEGGFGHSDFTTDFSNLPEPPVFINGEKTPKGSIEDTMYDRMNKTYVYLIDGKIYTQQQVTDMKL